MSPELSAIALVLLVIGTLFGSGILWHDLLRRWRAGEPWLEPATAEFPRRPLLAIVAALAWITLSLIDRIYADITQTTLEPSANIVNFVALQSLTVLAVISTLLFATGRFRPLDAGLDFRRWRESLGYGVDGFLAAAIPTTLLLLATAMFRSEETQHPLLRVLENSSDRSLVLLLALTVVFLGPLSEELIFRVILQGWLSRWCRPTVALAVTSVIFATVHGWKDGIALLPLAFILSYVYDRRRDLLAVFAMHGTFNAFNLIMMLLSLDLPK